MRRYTNTHSRQARIGVIGAGNSGRISIHRLLQKNYYHADFILVDTDQESLNKSQRENGQLFDHILLADQKSPFPNDFTGTDGNINIGEKATRGTYNRIKAVIQHFDLIFLVGGLGGGTASAALPIIAQAAGELNIMTVAIVTSPFGFEGLDRHRIAYQSITALNSLADTLIVIHGDELLQLVNDRTNLDGAWAEADTLRHKCIHIIEQLTQYPGIINIDFADVKTVMEGNGTALMTMGTGRGENKVADAVEEALTCSLLNRSIIGAGNVLMHIVTPPDHDFFEVANIAESVTNAIGKQADIIWGVSEDTCLNDEVQILMLATGFCEITQISHSTTDTMRIAREEELVEIREKSSLADHFWSLAKGHLSGYARRRA